MLICEAGRGLALGSVAVAALLGSVTVAQLVVVAFVEGSLFVFFDLSEGAALPRLVHENQLPSAIAQNQARTQGADLVGQPLGGALFSVARAAPFLFDAVSYLVSLGALLLIRTPLQGARPAAESDLRREIAEGLRTVLGSSFLKASVVVTGGINFVFNALALVLIVRAQDLGAGPALIGGMFAFWWRREFNRRSELGRRCLRSSGSGSSSPSRCPSCPTFSDWGSSRVPARSRDRCSTSFSEASSTE